MGISELEKATKKITSQAVIIPEHPGVCINQSRDLFSAVFEPTRTEFIAYP